MKPRLPRLLFLVALTTVLVGASAVTSDNGFDLDGSLIPAEEVQQGGPPRDGIPAIDNPKFVTVGEADFLDREDRVLGIVRDGQARAYPISILNWHEIVNDRIGGERIAVTYCPLCGTGVAYRSQARGRSLSFGVSGLLYNSDVLLYDRETESLWSQIMAKAVTGPMRGEKLEVLPLTHTSWKAWKREHPDTLLLSEDTGFSRDYSRDPYGSYAEERGLFFAVSAESRRYHPKEQVLGVEIGGKFKAYPFSELSRAGQAQIEDRFNGRTLRIRYDRDNRSARAYDEKGRQLPAINGFWFAWYAFHPETEVFTAR
jgi:hypothetical protein